MGEFDQDSRDLLIKVSTCVEKMDNRLKNLDDKLEKRDIIFSKYRDDCNRFFVPSKLFYVAVALIIGFVTTVSVMAYQNRQDLEVHWAAPIHVKEVSK